MKNELCEAEFLDIDWDTTRAGKGNYPFYMEKEIMDSRKQSRQHWHLDMWMDAFLWKQTVCQMMF